MNAINPISPVFFHGSPMIQGHSEVSILLVLSIAIGITLVAFGIGVLIAYYLNRPIRRYHR